VRIKGSQASTNFTLSDYNRELTEHELKQVEMQNAEAFRALELTAEVRAASGLHLPLAEELEALDLKALSCADPSLVGSFVEWFGKMVLGELNCHVAFPRLTSYPSPRIHSQTDSVIIPSCIP
jgi:hypothetical protein